MESQASSGFEPPAQGPVKVFISYSGRDRQFLEDLLVHLRPLETAGAIETFHNQKLAPGQRWRTELRARLTASSIVIFLVSPYSLESGFIDAELAAAIAERARIVPVILRPCNWQDSPLAQYRVLPLDGFPITVQPSPQLAWADVAREVADIARESGQSRTQLPRRHEGSIRRIAVAPRGRLAASAGEDGNAIVWDLTTMEAVKVLRHQAAVTDVEFVSDDLVATGSHDGAVKIFVLAGDVEPVTLYTTSAAVVALSAGVTTLAALCSDGTIGVWGLESRKVKHRFKAEGSPATDILVLRSSAVATVHADGWCRVWNVSKGQPRAEFQVASAPIVEFRNGEAGMCVSGCKNGHIQVFDPSAPVHRREFRVATVPLTGIALLPDLRHAVAACADNAMRLCDLATSATLRQQHLGSDVPTAVAVSEDGRRAICGSSRGTLTVWPLDTTVQRTLPEGRERLRLAYLAALELPQMWRVLDTMDEAALASVAEHLALPPGSDVVEYLSSRHQGAEPPPLWVAWMETIHPAKLTSRRP
jgi:hypothetical protein